MTKKEVNDLKGVIKDKWYQHCNVEPGQISYMQNCKHGKSDNMKPSMPFQIILPQSVGVIFS